MGLEARGMRKLARPTLSGPFFCPPDSDLASINLGWETIGAEVYDQDHNAVHLELIEVDENLCRAELTAAEKAAAMKKRKILWESLREQQAPGGNLVSTRRNDDGTFQKGDEKEKGFAASTAEITGMSKRAINE